MTADKIKALDKQYEAVGWGLWLLWIGVIDLIPGLPDGTGMLGTGLLLLGLNFARYRRYIPVNEFSLILGLLALLDGGMRLLRSLFVFDVELEFFPVLLVVVGVMMAVRAADRLREVGSANRSYHGIEKPKRGLSDTSEFAAEEAGSALSPIWSEGECAEILQHA